MSKPDLIQRRFFERKEFTIEENGVTITQKNMVESKKHLLRFEDLPPHPEEVTIASRKTFLAVMILSFFALVSSPLLFKKDGWEFGVTMWVLCFFFWAIFLVGRKSYYVYSHNKIGLLLFKKSPTAEKVQEFLKDLFAARNDYLIRKYGKFSDLDALEDKMGRLNFLRSQEVIGDEEYERKTEEFQGKKSNGPVGFNQQ